MYTQNNEEEIILAYFGDRKGTVLDIGANDGKTFSNSLALIERGWNADLVEASPIAFSKLKYLHQDREGVFLHNIAIVGEGESGFITLHESGSLISDKDHALVSTVVPSEKERWNSLNMQWKEVTVQAVNFHEFTKLSPFEKYELITIDIEGKDWDVLKQIDLSHFGCEMLIVEWNGNIQACNKFETYADAHGLKCIHTNPENMIFAR